MYECEHLLIDENGYCKNCGLEIDIELDMKAIDHIHDKSTVPIKIPLYEKLNLENYIKDEMKKIVIKKNNLLIKKVRNDKSNMFMILFEALLSLNLYKNLKPSYFCDILNITKKNVNQYMDKMSNFCLIKTNSDTLGAKSLIFPSIYIEEILEINNISKDNLNEVKKFCKIAIVNNILGKNNLLSHKPYVVASAVVKKYMELKNIKFKKFNKIIDVKDPDIKKIYNDIIF